MSLSVVDDSFPTTDTVQYVFNDGSQVVVKENRPSGSVPYCTKIAGDFTPEQCKAITAYSRLEVK